MSFESYVAKRLVKSKPYKNTVSSPIIKISILSIVIGIVMMIISISSSVGLQKTIESKVSSFFGHISISNFENNSSFSSLNPFINDFDYNLLQSNDKIKYFQKVAYKSGLIIKSNNFEGVVLKGVTSKFNWEDFSKYITSGRVISLNSNISNEVIISEILSNKLLINLGDKFKATFFKSNSLSIPNERIFKVVGIYNSGLIEFDQLYFFGDIRHIQKMNKWNIVDAGGIEIFLNKYSHTNEVSIDLYNQTQAEISVMSINERFPEIFNWMSLFDFNVLLIIIIMILVGGINMITALLVTVLEKTTFIGILKTVGASNKSIRSIFLINGAYLIGLGLLIGNVIGLGLIFFQNATGFIKLDPQTYYVSEFPFDFNFMSLIILNFGVLFFCFLMLIIPSYIITRISPTKSIRIK
ncbi:MAG: ABC transporter permease [Flavobacteriaceae bacterium]|nr:ABC transporter permease [Flavobacteriaceae bacterium]